MWCKLIFTRIQHFWHCIAQIGPNRVWDSIFVYVYLQICSIFGGYRITHVGQNRRYDNNDNKSINDDVEWRKILSRKRSKQTARSISYFQWNDRTLTIVTYSTETLNSILDLMLSKCALVKGFNGKNTIRIHVLTCCCFFFVQFERQCNLNDDG